ncbi:MAG: cysteine--tRNA ligase, partial [Polyangia bacterium]|nr:cysteine--tRNA ligase [Polyangia bacterium]
MLRLFDTLTGEKQELVEREPGKVGIYVCGPTVYDFSHLGHARVYVVFDVVTRTLRQRGYAVTYVRNFTDVDDKIIARANERGLDPVGLAAEFAQAFSEDMGRLGCLSPDVEPRVSEHVQEIISVVSSIQGKGLAYQSGDTVWFSVRKHQGYGKLSRRNLDDLRAGARVEADAAKQDPLDFALWKGAKPGEPSWESPWGLGRPGWHIECSAMSMKYLGEQFDIHGGGMDLVFPHHENEIAQSEAAHGPGFAKFWMHNGFVNLNQEKMSKSTGNFFTLRELFRRVEPEAIRLFLLSVQYRHPINFKVEDGEQGEVRFPDLEESERRLSYFYDTLQRLEDLLGGAKEPGPGPVVEGIAAAGG